MSKQSTCGRDCHDCLNVNESIGYLNENNIKLSIIATNAMDFNEWNDFDRIDSIDSFANVTSFFFWLKCTTHLDCV